MGRLTTKTFRNMALLSLKKFWKEISEKSFACINQGKKFHFLHTLFFIVFATIICCGFESCKKKKVDYNVLINQRDAKKKALEKKVNKLYCYKITETKLNSHFSQIDTVLMYKESNALIVGGEISLKTGEIGGFYVKVSSKGKVTGTIDGKKGEYDYNFYYHHIDVDEMDSPFLNDYSLFVKDKEGYYVLQVVDGKKDDTQAVNDEIKAMSKKDIYVDGIKVKFLSKDDSAGFIDVYYCTDKKLTDNQIRKACKKIKMSYDIAHFKLRTNERDYAYYVYDGSVIKHRSENSHVYY